MNEQKALKVGKGDIITIEAVSKAYSEGRNIDTILIETPTINGMEGLMALAQASIYSIDKHPIHESLEQYGVNVSKYAVNAIKVETIAFNTPSEGMIRINGSVDMPMVSKAGKQKPMDSFFMDFDTVKRIVLELNKVERDHIVTLLPIVEKAVGYMEELCSNERI